MKRFGFIVWALCALCLPLQAQWCGRPCTERYYNPQRSWDEHRYYGYFDINDYPYALPVNIYFNPRPSPCVDRFDDYLYLMRCRHGCRP